MEAIVVNLTADEIRVIELYREALVKRYADLHLIVHDAKLASASLTEKFKF